MVLYAATLIGLLVSLREYSTIVLLFSLQRMMPICTDTVFYFTIKEILSALLTELYNYPTAEQKNHSQINIEQYYMTYNLYRHCLLFYY